VTGIFMAGQGRVAGVKWSDVPGVTSAGSVSGGGFVRKDVPRSGKKPVKSPSPPPPWLRLCREGKASGRTSKPRASATAEESRKTKRRRTIETESLTAADKLRHCLTARRDDRAGQRVGARRFQSYDGARMDGQPVGHAGLGACPWGGCGLFVLPSKPCCCG